MSELEITLETGLEPYQGEVFDAPNKQSLGLDPPWVEGTGGHAGDTTEPSEPAAGEEATLDAMTKDQLLAYAQSRGISPANASMTKDEIRASIEAAES